MLKPSRNTLGDWGVLLDDEGKQIRWSCFKALIAVQKKTDLRLASKIMLKHKL
jgi:hypothetical protein